MAAQWGWRGVTTNAINFADRLRFQWRRSTVTEFTCLLAAPYRDIRVFVMFPSRNYLSNFIVCRDLPGLFREIIVLLASRYFLLVRRGDMSKVNTKV